MHPLDMDTREAVRLSFPPPVKMIFMVVYEGLQVARVSFSSIDDLQVLFLSIYRPIKYDLNCKGFERNVAEWFDPVILGAGVFCTTVISQLLSKFFEIIFLSDCCPGK